MPIGRRGRRSSSSSASSRGRRCGASSGQSSTRIRSSTSIGRAAVAAPADRPSLRARSTSFVGRRRELREIRALLGRPGRAPPDPDRTGGNGQDAARAEATAGLDAEFPGGVVLVELAPIVDPDLVATDDRRRARPERERRSADRSRRSIASLRGRRTLLVLDNFEQVLDAAPMLASCLAGAPA